MSRVRQYHYRYKLCQEVLIPRTHTIEIRKKDLGEYDFVGTAKQWRQYTNYSMRKLDQWVRLLKVVEYSGE